MSMIGKTVKQVREMTRDELEREGWERSATCVEFTDGTLIYASRDEEGNGPGCLFGVMDNKTVLIDC